MQDLQMKEMPSCQDRQAHRPASKLTTIYTSCEAPGKSDVSDGNEETGSAEGMARKTLEGSSI